MPWFRYWFLEDKEDPENDATVDASDASEAAELAIEEMINDGDCDLSNNHKIELAVRPIENGVSLGPAQMFEVFVDWSPNCTAYGRGELPGS